MIGVGDTGVHRTYLGALLLVKEANALRAFGRIDDKDLLTVVAGDIRRLHPGGPVNGVRAVYEKLAAEIIIDGDELRIGSREALFPHTNFYLDGTHAGYDVHPDGRFLMVQLGNFGSDDGLIIVENLADEIEGR